MKLAVLNDTHAGIRNSSDIFLEYQRRFYDEQFFPYLKEHGITQILHLGDYYDHRKFINFKSQNQNRKMFLEPMREMGITMDIIPGNHDVFFKNTNDLCSLKELLGYYTSNVNIMMQPKVQDYDGLKIACVPWINNENYTESIKFLKSCDAQWVGAHLELQGFEMMRGVTNTHGMTRDVFKRFELVMSGHFHTKSNQDNIHYLGSQFEFNWSDAGDPKYFHIIDTETRELTPIQSSSIFKVSLYYHSGGSHAMRLKRGSTVVFQPTDTYFNYDGEEYSGQSAWNSSSSRRVVAMSYVDSPATTSQITYSWQLAAYLAANGSGAGINELTGTSGSAYTYMEILEIAQ